MKHSFLDFLFSLSQEALEQLDPSVKNLALQNRTMRKVSDMIT